MPTVAALPRRGAHILHRHGFILLFTHAHSPSVVLCGTFPYAKSFANEYFEAETFPLQARSDQRYAEEQVHELETTRDNLMNELDAEKEKFTVDSVFLDYV